MSFSQKFVIVVWIKRIGIFLRHNNILIGVHHDPGTLRIGYGAGRFQSLRYREGTGGLALHNLQVPAVLVVLRRLCCG